MTKPDNPPAFPNAGYMDPAPGMSLRDWFAGQALGSIPSRSWDHLGKDADIIAAWASCAYALADAMLSERAKGGKDE